MNTQQYNTIDPEFGHLCHAAMNRVYIGLGSNGFSVCRQDQSVEGDCLFEGIQDLGVAQELTEMLIGELEFKAMENQQQRALVFG
ncbi:MAG: hypothetical protein HQL93_05520 [Magnetococcales bacterium]|nr:hypothetical protein [Magnetococcales bacterium]